MGNFSGRWAILFGGGQSFLEVRNISGHGNPRELLSKEECDWTEGLLKGGRFASNEKLLNYFNPLKQPGQEPEDRNSETREL